MRLIADRGFRHLYPENTLRAVDEAVATADAVAVDVRRCGSGELVVVHDETVDRVTDGTGRVEDLTATELAALDVLGTGEGVPTLEAVFQTVPRGIGLVTVLREPDLAADVIELASRVDTHVVVTSSLVGELAAARVVDSSVPRAFMFHPDDDPMDALQTAQGVDAAFLYAPTEHCHERLVGEAHVTGMMVVGWPVTSRSEATRLQKAGVDGVVADRWGVLPPVEQ